MTAETRVLLETIQDAFIAQQGAEAGRQTAVVEAFDRIRGLLTREDKGWVPVFGGGGGEQFGMELADLKKWAPKILESIPGAPWMGQGFRLRHSYVWQNGIRYGNIPEPTRGKTNVQNLIDDSMNQIHFFSKEARRQRELRLYAEGVAFYIGDDATKKIEAIPLYQIVDQFVDPNGLGLAWAYKRKWTEIDIRTGEKAEQERWYFTDRFWEKRVDNIAAPGQEPTEVDQSHRIFDLHANRMGGLVYGSPDALAAYVWNGIVRDAYMDGVAMVQALATFALKASVKTAGGGQAAALQFANPQGPASTAVVGGANDLVPMASAGKGYDFMSLNALTAIVATSLSVSNIALTSDTANAGSSYGSAQTLDLPVRLAMESRRDDHVDFDSRVLKWMGVDKPDVFFIPFASGEETYRATQALGLEYAGDTMSRQEYRDRLDDLNGRPSGTVPSEDQRPSVLAAKALAKAVPKPAATADDSAPGTQKQIASPNQGRGNGTGGQSGAANDLRSDTIT